jgi:hypothetical protein
MGWPDQAERRVDELNNVSAECLDWVILPSPSVVFMNLFWPK